MAENRRGFLKQLAVAAIAPSTVAVAVGLKDSPPAELPEFEAGQVLTHEDMNRIVVTINGLMSQDEIRRSLAMPIRDELFRMRRLG